MKKVAGSILLFLAASLPSAFAQQAPAPALPAAAQEAEQKGVLAANGQDYLLAIRYFEDARKVAPNAPDLFFNLGLAESKVPGRELRSMAWFGAYLAANPNAPNAAAVKQQINALDVRSQSNIEHLIDTLKELSGKLAVLGGGYQSAAIANITVLYAETGDDSQAVQLMDAGSESQRQLTCDIVAMHLISNLDSYGINSEEAKAWLNRLQQLDPDAAGKLSEKMAQAQADAAQRAEERKKMTAEERVRRWTDKFDGYELNRPGFLDISAYLKRIMDQGGDPEGQSPYYNPVQPPAARISSSVEGATRDIIMEHNEILGMMAEQSKQ